MKGWITKRASWIYVAIAAVVIFAWLLLAANLYFGHKADSEGLISNRVTWGQEKELMNEFMEEKFSEDGVNTDYCADLESSRFGKIWFPHLYCIIERVEEQDLAGAKKIFQYAVSVLHPVDVSFFPLFRDTTSGEPIAGLESESECVKTLRTERQELMDFPLSEWLPGVASYRLVVNPGLEYSEFCRFQGEL